MLGAETCACPHEFVGNSLAGYCGGSFVTFMALLEVFINGRCAIRDPCNRVTPKRAPDYEYDFIVVGGGTAGPVVASRLSENPEWKVLLLEAGDDEPTPAQVPMLLGGYWGNPATDWLYKSEPQKDAFLANPDNRCSWPRGKLLGGCTVFNGMMYMRGNPRDYDNWVSKDGVEGWSFSDVLPYFKKSEDNRQIGIAADPQYHSTGGLVTIDQFRHISDFTEDFIKGADEVGLGTSKDLNGDKLTGFAVAQAYTRDGMRLSAARAFLRPASKRPNLHIMVNSTATKVVINQNTKNVEGVEFLYQGQKLYARASKEVILSAGAMNSPQLLLLSGVGPKEDLTALNIPVVHDLPGVGKNFHNHVALSVPVVLNKVNDTNLLNWASLTEYLLQRTGVLTSTGNWQITGKLNTKYADPDGHHPDMQYFIAGYGAGCSMTGSLEELSSPGKRQVGIYPTNLRPMSRGYVKLRSTDPLEAPLMEVNYLQDHRDVERLIDGTKLVVKIADSKLLQDKYGFEIDKAIGDCLNQAAWGSDAYWECAIRHNTGPENHHVGSCKMGPSTDNLAVLDNELRVFGVNGLRVMDASAIPTVTSGNTATPTIMIAERGADFIKANWGFKDKVQSTQLLSDRFSADKDDDKETPNNAPTGNRPPNSNRKPDNHRPHGHHNHPAGCGYPFGHQWPMSSLSSPSLFSSMKPFTRFERFVL